MNTILKLKKEIISFGKEAYQCGLMAFTDGNISVRYKDKVLITASSVCKGTLSQKDIVVVGMDGKVFEGAKPSSELFLHLKIYENRKDVTAIFHAHPSYATGFAVAGIALDKPIVQEAVLKIGAVPIIPYGTTGTPELYNPLIPFLKKHDGFLLANHGAITIGKNLFSAYDKMVTLEQTAKIIFIAKQLGKVKILTKNQAKKLMDLKNKKDKN